MEENKFNYQQLEGAQQSGAQSEIIDGQAVSGEMAKSFMANVFTYMGGGLALSAIMAWVFGHSDYLMSYLINESPMGNSPTLLGWIVMLAPLGFVILMGVRFQKMSAMGLLASFIAFCTIDGISLSFIFMHYADSSIISTFIGAAGMFGIMSFVGYTTKTDLTKLGSILFMALIGLIIAMVINMFMNSGPLQYVISVIGVLLFAGLTAYDTQKLKNIGMQVGTGTATASKMAIMGALSLYLDFINLFLFLLQLFGSRD